MSTPHGLRIVEAREKRLLAAATAASILLAALAFAAAAWEPGIGGDAIVTRYFFHAEPGPGDTIILREEVTYRIQSLDYHMVYRSWNWPLAPPGGDAPVALAGLDCPEGLTPYLVDSEGRVEPLAPLPAPALEDLRGRIEEAGARSEAGCYSLGGLEPGFYTVTYEWILEPPPEAVLGDAVLLPVAVEGRHLDYASIGGVAEWPEAAAAPWPLNEALRPGDGSTLLDPVPLDSGAGLVLALGPEGSRGVEEYREGAERAYTLAERLSLAGAAGAALAPVLAAALYAVAGRERPLAAPPRPDPWEYGEKPWQVNVLYHGEPGRASWDAVAATVLDLAARGVVRVEEGPRGPELVLPERAEGLDWYEERVLRLLRILAGDSRLPLGEIRDRARRRARAISRLARELLRGRELRRLGGEAVESRSHVFALLVALFLALAFPVNMAVSALLPLHDNNAALRVLLSNLLAAGSAGVYMALPSHVLGRWRPGYLERYAAWLAFRERARRAPPVGDARLLAYLLALGEHEAVEEALASTPGEAIAGLRELVKSLRVAAPVIAAAGGSGGAGGGGAGAR